MPVLSVCHRTRLVLGHNLLKLAYVNRLSRRTVKTSTFDWKPVKTKYVPGQTEGTANSWNITRKIALSLMVAMPVITFYLGTWQYRRLSWKNDLIAKCETRLTQDPKPLPPHFTEDMCEDWEYRRVTLKGQYVHEDEMYVGPRSRYGEKGYIVYTPFIRSDTKERFLVERGWISSDRLLPQSRSLTHLSIPMGEVKITCLVRRPIVRGSMQWSKDDPNSRLWLVPDIYDMAASSGCSTVPLQVIYDLKDHPEQRHENSSAAGRFHWLTRIWKNDSITSVDHGPVTEFDELQFAKAGVPIGKQPKVDFRNNHLQYLVTWYGLSFLSSIFLVVALRKYKGGAAVSQQQLKRDKLKYAKKYT